MDKAVTGLIAALSAVAAAVPSQAAPATPAAVRQALEFSSYADLLKPIPNAVAILQAAEAEEALPSDGQARVETVQFYHHHHHRYFRRHFYHHHHHHHRFHRYY